MMIPSDVTLPEVVLPTSLFAIPVSGSIIFPTLMAPVMVVQPQLVASIEEVLQNRNRFVGLLMSKSGEMSERVNTQDLYLTGVAVRIIKRLKHPDGSVNLLVQSMKRFKVKSIVSERPHFVIEPEYFEEVVEKSTEMDALMRSVVAQVKKLSETNPFFTEEMRMAMINAPGPGAVADLVAFALSLSREDSQEFLETRDVRERFEKLLLHLRREQNVADVQKKINDEVNGKISEVQREFFLKEQLKTIKRELGMEEDGKSKVARTFRERIEAAGMPDDIKKIALEELEKFETISEQSPEYNLTRNYLETLCSLPWNKETEDRVNLRLAKKALDREHYGLEKVKERILEFLAVRILKKDQKGSIICLVGPPGVGKTSIGRSIAATLGRKFYRFSLGGMRDEAEIKGHRRTYVGAMPGKVIQALRRAGSKNAVIMLDEIDKLGSSYQGDPASALLEALDPEQNSAFIDHYVDVPFDLSRILFITTANSLSSIPAPLLDRMEVVEIPGYTLEEKQKIAERFVIPKELKENGLTDRQVKITKDAIKKIMFDYAREPGLRILQQLIGRLSRKAAIQIVTASEKNNGKFSKKAIIIQPSDLHQWLGPKRYYNETAERITQPGVVTGLAWTSTGGDILFIEVITVPGSGQLKLTGQMGDVMNESAQVAWSHVKKILSKEKKITQEELKNIDLHLHIPAGAIPKDGPSAGITMAAALYSLFSNRIARAGVAMTGELSLTGKVLAVGGIKEKILAAKRAGITEIILPHMNQKDLAEVPKYALKGMKIKTVRQFIDVIPLVLSNLRSTKK